MTSALILASPDKYIGVHRERSSRGGASDGRPSSAYGKFVTLGVTRGLPAVAPPVSLMTLPISPLLPRRTVIMLWNLTFGLLGTSMALLSTTPRFRKTL